MNPYNADYDPPAITLTILVAGVVHRRPQIELTALVDTGADITAVPEALVEKLNLYPFGRLNLEDARAVITPVYSYEASISLPGEERREMEVLLTPYTFVILGRDWLQEYYLLLDGPGQQFQLSNTPL